MPQSHQIIRKVERPTIADFDEQWWPINVLLGALAAVVAVVIVKTGDFHTHNIFRSAIMHMGVLAAIVVGLSLSSLLLRGRMQRRMQLAVLFSLVLHLWLCLVSYYTYLGMVAQTEADLGHAEDRQRLVRQPEHTWQISEHAEAANLLERPVETETPEAEQPDPQRAQAAAAKADKPSLDEPAASQPQLPSPAELEKAKVTAPRRSEQLAGPTISRSELADQQPVESPAEVPRVEPQPAQQRSTEATSTPLERLADAAQVERRATPDEPLAPQLQPQPLEPQPLAAQRRDTETPPAEPRLAVLDRPQRALTDAPDVQPAQIAAPRAVQADNAPPRREVEAAAAALARRGNTPADSIERAAVRADDAGPSEPATTSAGRDMASQALPRRASGDPRPMPATEPAPASIARAGTLGGVQIASTAEAIDPAPATADRASRGDLSPAAAAQGRSQQAAPDSRYAAVAARSGAAPSAAAQLASAAVGQPRRLESPATSDAGAATRPSRSPTRATLDTPGGEGIAGGTAIDVPTVAGASSGISNPDGASVASDPQPSATAGGAPRHSSGGLPNGALVRRGASAPGESGVERPGPGAASLLAGAPGRARRGDSAGADVGSLSGGAAGGQRLARATPGAAGGLPNVEPAEIPALGAAGPQPGGAQTGGAQTAGQQPPNENGGGLQPAASSGSGRLADAGPPRSSSSSGLPVRIAAPEGPGGLSYQPAADPGLPTRRARPESDVVHSVASRMILEKSGGRPTIDARVRDTAVPAYKQRDAQDREQTATSRGGTQGTERAVELGLDFLARHQSPDGSWSLHNFAAGRAGYERAGQAQMQSDSAGTGLALLAFLGAGYTHTDGKYRLVVGRGLDHLVRTQKPDGDLFSGGSQYCWLYSHGIASIALCEAYGMTRDAAVREPAQRALSFIAAAQHPEEGGWRYSPGRDSDTSVSGWQLMALKSGELSGLEIPQECYSRIEHWLDGAAGKSNPSRYVYRPKAEQAHQREPSLAMTAEALLMRQYLGWKRNNANLVAGADFLRANLPQLGTRGVPRRDAYYWYYATQVMFQMQGEHWKDWNAALRKLLVDSQVQSGLLAGSWDPLGPTVPDRWGAAGGRIYVTAMHLLMLEVYYRHLPLYQTLEE